MSMETATESDLTDVDHGAMHDAVDGMALSQQPRRKAYLLVRMKPEYPLPTVTGVRITSSPPMSMTIALGSEFYTEILQAEAPSFQEAHDSLLRTVWREEWLAWARFWLAEDINSHTARGYVSGKISPSLPERLRAEETKR